MSQLTVVPEDPQGETWDVIVIGAGMGGSTVGHALARQGRRVLFVEKGHYLFGDHLRGDGNLRGAIATDPQDRLNEGLWPVQVDGNTSLSGPIRMFAPLGCGTGGSSGLYAAQLERLMPSDLEPRRYYRHVSDSTVPETWPVTYDELVPYYRRAERIFTVCGTQDPLNPDPESPMREPPPASPRDSHISEALAELGLHPYRAHVGCRYVPGCTGCGGVLCPRDCKADAGLVCLRPAVTEHGAKILPDAEVTRLEARGERVTRVHYVRHGVEGALTGKVVVVAAGALMTPALLLRSASDTWPAGLANRSGQVGRNLMLHTGDFIAIRPHRVLSADGPHKSISLNDLYIRNGQKLGTFQSVGMPVSAGIIHGYLRMQAEMNPKWYNPAGVLGHLARRIAARVGAAVFRGATVFGSVVEDLPYACNRVVLDASNPNGMRFEYTYPDELKARTQLYRNELRKLLAPKLNVLVLNGENNLNFGHALGTCRSGDDPAVSVIDRDNRAHDLENLYIADGSAFPSSGGTNPSLTIAANSLRVADAIAKQLGNTKEGDTAPSATGRGADIGVRR